MTATPIGVGSVYINSDDKNPAYITDDDEAKDVKLTLGENDKDANQDKPYGNTRCNFHVPGASTCNSSPFPLFNVILFTFFEADFVVPRASCLSLLYAVSIKGESKLTEFGQQIN